MARKRMIDPTIWADEDFGTLSSEAMIMYIGMISNADDEGRLPGNALFLTSTILPFRGLNPEKSIQLRKEILYKMKSLVLYEVKGKEYLQFKNWSKYQSINKPSSSKYPSLPEDYCSDTELLPPNRIEENRIEENRNTGENRPENNISDKTSIKEILKGRQYQISPNKSGISTEWQLKAFKYAEDLGIKLEKKDKPRWVKIFKQAYDGRKSGNLANAYTYCRDHPKWPEMQNEARMKMVFYIYENGLSKQNYT